MDNIDVVGFGGLTIEIAAIWVLAILSNWIVGRACHMLRNRYEKQKQVWAECFFTALREPLRLFIWFFAIAYTFSDTLLFIKKTFAQSWIDLIMRVGTVFVLWWFLSKWKRLVVQKMIAKSKSHEIVIDTAKIDAIDKICTLAILFFVTLLLLEATNRSVSTLIAFGGIGGLALAFASQEIIANFFGGLMIYITKPFAIDDWIQLPDHAIEGIVEEIGWYTTHIRSLEKQPMYIPNSLFNKLIVITRSRMSHRQIKEIVGVRSDDYSKLRSITEDIQQQLKSHPDIDHAEPIIVRFHGFGAYTLDIYVCAYTHRIDTSSYMRVKESILLLIGDTVIKHGAEIPNPTQNVTLLPSIQTSPES